MVADADDLALFQNDDAVGVEHCADALRDDEGRCVLSAVLERGAERCVGFVVERGEGVVKDVDLRLAADRAGDREPLLLAAGEVRAALRDRTVAALGQFVYELAALRRGDRRGDVVVRRRGAAVFAVCDV